MLKMSALKLFGAQFTSSTQLIKPNYLILSQILGSVVPSSCFLSHSEEAPDAGHDYEYEKRQT